MVEPPERLSSPEHKESILNHYTSIPRRVVAAVILQLLCCHRSHQVVTPSAVVMPLPTTPETKLGRS